MRASCFVLALVVVTSSPTFADPALDKQAKAHSQRAQELYRDGKYAEARAEFSASYDLSRRPGFVFNMAECSRLAGDLTAARQHYQNYLALAPDGSMATLARQRLAALPGSTERAAPPPVVPPPVMAPPVTAPAAASPTVTAPPPAPLVAHNAEPTLTGTAAITRAAPERSMWTRWPVWVAVGAGVIATSALIYVAARSDRDPCGPGCIDWQERK